TPFLWKGVSNGRAARFSSPFACEGRSECERARSAMRGMALRLSHARLRQRTQQLVTHLPVRTGDQNAHRAHDIPPPLRGDPLPAEGGGKAKRRALLLPLRLRRGIEGDGRSAS